MDRKKGHTFCLKGHTLWELWPGGVNVGHSIQCPLCGQKKNLSWIPSGKLLQDEALNRLIAWSQCCPGDPLVHKDVGAVLLKEFAT